MLELNDTLLEAVSGGYGSSFTFKANIKKNMSKIQIDRNKIINGAIEVGVTQVNGSIYTGGSE